MPRVRSSFAILIALGVFVLTKFSMASELETRMIHLRSAGVREWATFPATAQGADLETSFASQPNTDEFTLSLRQQDVKQTWRVTLNDRVLGSLVIDENDMRIYFAIPKGTLKAEGNVLRIAPTSRSDKTSDDIRVGEIRIDPRPMVAVLNDGSLRVLVTDSDSGKPTPCRLTILDDNGSLQSSGIEQPSRQWHAQFSKDWMKAVADRKELPRLPAAGSAEAPLANVAVRAGTVFSANGEVTLGLPIGRYTVIAGRGFEYSITRTEVVVTQGETVTKSLQLRREVPTSGLVACDTHCHTLTYSGHGDAALTERLVTIAGEGLELPVAADHNVHVDYEPVAQAMNLRGYFTPIMGNEVTTSVGHFNIFPIKAGIPVIDHKETDWGKLFDRIEATPGVRVAVLNHARDLHSNTRPFGPKLHHAVVGENAAGWPLRFNAMETVNSGTTQYDPLQLFHDWMALLNRGLKVTPIGSSDSHDVARHFVGQGRTYIRCDDRDVGQIDIDAAMNSLTAGRAMVSYGLLTELTIRQNKDTSRREVHIRVLGPSWVHADQIRLYVNGELLEKHDLNPPENSPRKLGNVWERICLLPDLIHDAHVVAIATGPGIDAPFWRTAKPYQWLSEDWSPRVIGCSEAVWIDADNDGQISSARDYARQAVDAAQGDLPKLFQQLATHNEATAAQAAFLISQASKPVSAEQLNAALKSASPRTQTGFERFQESVRQHTQALNMP